MSESGRRAVVTAGAGGIGLATRRVLESRGWNVVGIDVATSEDADERVLTADVADEAAVTHAIETAAERLSGLDALICVAGITTIGTAEETAPADWHRMMGVNLTGPYFCVRAALPHLRRGNSPAIVTVGSQFGLIAERRYVAYCASKAGLIHFTRALAVDHGREGIRVNCVCPGPVMTAGNRAYFRSVPDPEGELRRYTARTLSDRFAEPEETARVIAFLADPESSALSGSIVVADAGYSIH